MGTAAFHSIFEKDYTFPYPYYHIIPPVSLCKNTEYTAPFLCRENKGHFYLCKNLTNGRLRGILYSKEQMFGKGSMRIINIKAKKDGMEADTLFAGYCGESGQTCLAVFLDEELMGNYRYYLRFSTSEQAKRGGMSVTGELDCRDGLILYRLPYSLTRAGRLSIQLVVTEGGRGVYSPVLKGKLQVLCPVGEKDPPEEKGIICFKDFTQYLARRGKEIPFFV